MSDARKNIRLHRVLLTCLTSSVLCTACSSPLLPDDNGDDGTSTLTDDSIPAVPHDSVAIVHSGQDGDPYTVAEAQWVAEAQQVWVEGFVVGTVKGSMGKGCLFAPPFTVETNVLLADTFPCTPEDCIPVELPSRSLVHDGLNLVDNPSLLHEKRRVKGDLTAYFRTVGIRNVAIVAAVHTGDSIATDNTSTLTNSLDQPLDIRTAIAAQTGAADTLDFDPTNSYWVRGYIVGWSPSKNRVTVADSTEQCANALRTNVVLTDSIGETTPDHLLVVKLPDGCVRDDVNLVDNPSNLFHTLTVCGYLQPINNLHGCVDILGASRREDLAGHPLYRLGN